MISRALFPLALVLACAGTAQQDAGPPAERVARLVKTGRLDEAERVARGGGPELTVPLAELLILRGKLVEAESLLVAAIDSNRPGARTAQAALAELAARRGNRTAALRLAAVLADNYQLSGNGWPVPDRIAAGRAYVVLGLAESQAPRLALAAFDGAAAADPTNVEARLRAADLLIDRYNAPDAKSSYEEVLAIDPENARALLGMARVLSFENNPGATEVVRKAVAANPALVPGLLFLARMHLEAESYDSAAAVAGKALAVDSTALAAWGVMGAVAWLGGDSTGWRQARAEAARVHPAPADFYSELAEAAARHRRYAAAVGMAQEAVKLDSLSVRALGTLGTNLLRTGAIADGRSMLERAFALDPFHIWNKNTLDLLDNLQTFRTVRTARFEFVAPDDEVDLLALYLGPLLEEAYDSLAQRYDYRPPTPIRLELYRHHADFSVRTIGLAGLGALGVSFGTVLAMDAPSARNPGDFNWGSTAWHELAHTFTLGLSDHRVPRWYSEGLSVLEERRARAGWGADVSVEFLAAFKAGRIRKVSEISEGFVRPRHPAEIGFSYYQASLVCELIEQEHGTAALAALLRAYRDGLDTPAAFQQVLRLSPEEFDRRFDRFMRERFRTALAGLDAWDGKEPVSGGFIAALVRGRQLLAEGRVDQAKAELERAQKLFPEYSGQDSPSWDLARIAQQQGNPTAALEQLARITTHDETALEANILEAELRMQLGDSAGAAAALQRLIWIAPYQTDPHVQLAELAEVRGQYAAAIQERRAVLLLKPADRLEARYQLANTLFRAGRTAEARREVLQVLEQAPGFEKAHELLLQLRTTPPQGGN
ncbi:MAG: tetratricopeptide repeat protein [Gemmatimonadota bacterium]|nr:tetratricopeptide repeat protein [Gemmatimonadota bacterium]